jgi:hypothetical protein
MTHRVSKILLLLTLVQSQLFIAQTRALPASRARHANADLPIGAGIYDPAIEAGVEALLRKMTLEEKVGQTVQYSAGQPTGPFSLAGLRALLFGRSAFRSRTRWLTGPHILDSS